VFGDDVAAAAMINRLLHHAEVIGRGRGWLARAGIAVKGDSYRLKDRSLGRVPAAISDDQ